VNAAKMPATGDSGTPLNIYPRADGVQHCELAAMRETIEGYADRIPSWLGFFKGQLVRLNWPEEMRPISHDAPVNPSVRERFKLRNVVQCAGHGPYRPEALRHHDEFKTYYDPA